MSSLSFALLVSSNGSCGRMTSAGSAYIGRTNEGHIKSSAKVPTDEDRAASHWHSLCRRTRIAARLACRDDDYVRLINDKRAERSLPFTAGAIEAFVLQYSHTAFIRARTENRVHESDSRLETRQYAIVRALIEELVIIVLDTVRVHAQCSLKQGK